MVRHCCICKTEQGMIPNIFFHSIPKKEELKAKWIINIGQEVSKSSSVCSRHFNEKDYYFKLVGETVKQILVPTAVPSSELLTDGNDSLEPSTSQNSETRDKEEINKEIIEQEDSLILFDEDDISVDSELTDHDESKTPIRDLDEPLKHSKHSTNPRYIGDLHREHFTSDISWRIVHKYIQNSKRKRKALNDRVKRLNNELEDLKSILEYVKSLKRNKLEVNS